jgi:hypothetical protein
VSDNFWSFKHGAFTPFFHGMNSVENHNYGKKLPYNSFVFKNSMNFLMSIKFWAFPYFFSHSSVLYEFFDAD